MISRKELCGVREEKRIPTPAPPLQGEGKRLGWVFAECGRGNACRTAAAIVMLLFVAAASLSFAVETSPADSSAVSTATAVTTPSASDTISVGADAVQAVENHYRDLADLTARVVQKNFLKSVEKTQKFEGTLMIKRPGKLRLEYTNGQIIVIDGKDAWFYSKKSSQAIRRTFMDFEQANIPVAFLLGAAHIRDDFEVVERKGPSIRNTFDLTPKKKDAAMKKLGMVCDDNGRIHGLIIYDKSGNTSSLAFSEARENTGLDDARFQFKAPKGTEIIEQ